MSDSEPPRTTVGFRAGRVLLGFLTVFAVAVVVGLSSDRLLAIEFAVGLLAANVAFIRVRARTRASRWAAVFGFGGLNVATVAAACVTLGGDAPAWIFALPVALLAPRRILGDGLGTAVYILALAAGVGWGMASAGAGSSELAAAAVAVLAAGVAPWWSAGALELRGELSAHRIALSSHQQALERAEASSQRLEAQLRDDTDRLRRTEAELTARFQQRFAEVEARHEEILAAIVDAVMTVDSAGVITSANPAAATLMHAAREEIVGWPLQRFLPEVDVGTVKTLYRRAARGDITTATQLRTREFRCRRHDGVVIDVELGVGAFEEIDDDSSRGRHVAGESVYTLVIRDISARKRVERMKDELVATVSHELRTPLTAILGSISLMNGGAAGALPPKAKELLALAERNGGRLVKLIEDILDIQKMEAGKLEFEMDELDLVAVVSKAVESVSPMGEAKSVRYAFDAPDGLPTVYGDPGRIEQVVHNLLSNATKFTPADGVVYIGVAHRDNARLRVEVRDEGPGLPESMMTRIFERFEQGQSGDTRPPGGTGLGLAIARAIIERHGGEIGVSSQLGAGSTFYFELPESRSRPRVSTAELSDAVAELDARDA